MANFVYVDNSNVWIEGMHVSAVATGMALDIGVAMKAGICDFNWKLDFGKLLSFAGGDARDIGRAVLYGSRPPQNDSLWAAAKREGFEVVVYDRNVANREKKIDTRIVADIVADSYERMTPGTDEITLVAGDSDYVPAVRQLMSRGFDFDVVFWGQAARELRDACTRFVCLDEYLEYLARG